MNALTVTSSLTDMLNDFPVQHGQLADGGQQSWRESGDPAARQVVVLLHGISSGSGSWVQQLADLAGPVRVLAWDAPGYGGSDDLATATPSAADYAARLVLWLDHVKVERCWLVGHSLGAMVAAAFAAAYTDRIRGLLLASPAQGYGKQPDEVRLKVFQKRPQALQELGAEAMAATRAPALLSSRASDEQVALVADGMRKLRLTGFTAASWLLANDDIHDYLNPLIARDGVESLCVTVLCGSADEITPPHGARKLAEQLGTQRFATIAGAGHALYIEAPQAMNQTLLQWIKAAQQEQVV